MYEFIVAGLLNAVEGSPVRNALDSIHCDNLCSLIELIRKPGLIISLRWDGMGRNSATNNVGNY